MITLAQCISQLESDNDTDALRFEPELYSNCPEWISKQLENIAKIHSCTIYTAQMIACTSWGKYQILGANIYAKGYTKHIFDYVWDEEYVQDISFNHFVANGGFDWRTDISKWDQTELEKFAGFYNGPGNVIDYANKMKVIINEHE